ncbi:MAG TPA: glycosyltransferase [Cyclobacteriaceae bacterium]|nr:glycosyltransferase [Cyclobacteriaceae bacterium]
MNLFFFLVFGFYFVVMLLLLTGWQQSLAGKSSLRPEAFSPRKITVVVPFRNEEACIANVIQDLIGQELPPEFVEVILVDDHSADRSSEIIFSCLPAVAITNSRSEGGPPIVSTSSLGFGGRGRTQFSYATLPEGREGKKQAIMLGVEQAGGEIIVITDADCRLPIHWLQSFATSFHDGNVKMVFGGVRITEGKSFFSKLQALEFCSLIGAGAAMAGLGIPLLCNGANLAFLRSAFLEVKGYDGNLDIASGDDEFLMRKIDRRFPGSIRFQPVGDSVVETRPMESLKAFVGQRLRWAGKWKHNGSQLSQFTAVFIFVFQTSFLVLWFAPLLNWISELLALFLIAGKMIFEFTFLFQVGTFLHVRPRLFHFLVLQFLYPFYVMYIGVASLFTSPLWKGRKV